MRISDWSSDVCSSDLRKLKYQTASDIDSTSALVAPIYQAEQDTQFSQELQLSGKHDRLNWLVGLFYFREKDNGQLAIPFDNFAFVAPPSNYLTTGYYGGGFINRSEEHTSELQSLMRISYAVFCLHKKKNK